MLFHAAVTQYTILILEGLLVYDLDEVHVEVESQFRLVIKSYLTKERRY